MQTTEVLVHTKDLETAELVICKLRLFVKSEYWYAIKICMLGQIALSKPCRPSSDWSALFAMPTAFPGCITGLWNQNFPYLGQFHYLALFIFSDSHEAPWRSSVQWSIWTTNQNWYTKEGEACIIFKGNSVLRHLIMIIMIWLHLFLPFLQRGTGERDDNIMTLLASLNEIIVLPSRWVFS